MSVLVIGRGGQVARALARRAAARGISVQALGRPELDLDAPEQAMAAITQHAPAAVINAAAYTAVDKAEDEPARAWAVNAEGAGAVARAAAACAAALVHISTDYVFDGLKHAPYVETDAPSPAGAYGASKLAGEQLVLEAHPRAIVLRTAWVFDATGRNFVRTMLSRAKTREEIPVVADQWGCPTFADDLAETALDIAARPAPWGIFHCTGAGETTWAGFAEEIFAQAHARGGPTARVKPIATADFPTRARRPANSRLDCGKLQADYGVHMRPWRAALSACMNEIAAAGWRVE